MSQKIDLDHGRFKQIIRGKIKQDLRKYISQGEMIARRGKDTVAIPLPQVDVPRFKFGDKQQGGVGQGKGEVGDALGGEPGEEGDGHGHAGDRPGDHLTDLEVSLADLAEIMGEELELPRIEPKGTEKISTFKDRYSGIRSTGPESLRHFRRTYRQAMRRQISMGTYSPANPVIVPIREDKRYRSWRREPVPQSNAVIIYMMDVSGSMGDEQKEIVRIESFWLDTWLRSQYHGIESRFIIHDAMAKEVDRDTFFSTRESGGTMISSAYKLCAKLIDEVPVGDLEHLPVPLLRRRQLVGRRHRHLRRAAARADPAPRQPVRVRPGGVAVRLGPVRQGSHRALRRRRPPGDLGDQDQGRDHGLDQRVPREGAVAPVPAIKELPEYLRALQLEVEGHARAYGLDFFPILYEVLDYKTMNEVAAYGGFPTRYPHWRFGMDYEQLSKSYEWGLSKIYEMVINTNPSYAYLLEGNSLVDQKTVMAHVCAHVDFFKHNYFFSKTNRKMVDGMANHAARVRRHMARHGQEVVENFIDVCLSLENLIDPMSPFIVRNRVEPDDDEAEVADDGGGRLRAKQYMDKFINPPEYLEAQKQRREAERKRVTRRFPEEPQRDVLQFLIGHAPLEAWQRDVLEIVRDEAYYFVPQAMTKIMNEGWATYWHSKIMTEKALTAAEVIDYADASSGILATAPGRLNPYKLGVELYRDIEERWDKGQFGKEWAECDSMEAKRHWDLRLGQGRAKIFEVRRLYNDVTFLDEFFTLEFCLQQKFYAFGFSERSGNWEIMSRDFAKVKAQLLRSLTNRGQPTIVVEDGDLDRRGELLLRHVHDGVDLDLGQARDTLLNVYKVWTRPVSLLTKGDDQGRLLRCEGTEITERAAEYPGAPARR
ncbi:MAG: SpoVR family protein [Kofleriaceae bacterium]